MENLFYEARNGNTKIRNNLIIKYSYLIYRTLFSLNTEKKNIPNETSIAYFSLLKALNSYDQKKSLFSTYAIAIIKKDIVSERLSLIKQNTTHYTNAQSFRLHKTKLTISEAEEEFSTDNLIKFTQSKNEKKKLKRALSSLSVREQKVVFLYFFEEYSLKKIATELKISTRTVAKTKMLSLVKLKKIVTGITKDEKKRKN